MRGNGSSVYLKVKRLPLLRLFVPLLQSIAYACITQNGKVINSIVKRR